MANDNVGDALTEEPGKFEKLKSFMKKPENLATALVFAAALAQPRDQGRNGLQTFLQRGVGAAAFRGALERGAEDRAIERQEREFTQEQQEQQTGMQRRQVAAQETQAQAQSRRAETDAQRLQQTAQLEQQALAQQLQLATDPQLRFLEYSRSSYPAMYEAELERLQFSPEAQDMTAAEISQQAANNASLHLLTLFKTSSFLGQVGPDGTVEIPDEMLSLLPQFGTGTPAPQPGATGEPAPARPDPNVPRTGTQGTPRSPEQQRARSAATRAVLGLDEAPAATLPPVSSASSIFEDIRGEQVAAINEARRALETNEPLSPETQQVLQRTPLHVLREHGLDNEQIRRLLRRETP